MLEPSPFAVSDRLVADLVRLDPIVATGLGVPGHDDLCPDPSPDGHDARADVLRRRRAPASGVDHDERRQRLAAPVSTDWIDERLTAHESGDHLRDLAHMAGSFESIREIFDVHDRSTPRAWEAVTRRLASVSAPLDGVWTSLRTGPQRGLVQARRHAESVISQAEDLAGDGSAWRRLVAESRQTAPKMAVAVGQAQAAVAVFAERLRDEYLPHASDDDGAGRDLYLRDAGRLMRLAVDPEEAHSWGWEEIGRLRSALEDVASRIHGRRNRSNRRPTCSKPTRTDAPRRPATSSRSSSGASSWRTTGRRDPTSRRQRRYAGSRPDRPSRSARRCVLPGTERGLLPPREHLVLGRGPAELSAVSGGLHRLPATTSNRNHHGSRGTAQPAQGLLVRYPGYGEGWDLSAERLMDELGYLEKPHYVFGMLAGHIFRAARVVVDIGLHLGLRAPERSPVHPGEGGTFERAVIFVHRVGMQPPPYAASEVMRYLGWPGQGISYKLGERELPAIRERMWREQGTDFDLSAFHDRVLRDGQMRLDLVGGGGDVMVIGH